MKASLKIDKHVLNARMPSPRLLLVVVALLASLASVFVTLAYSDHSEAQGDPDWRNYATVVVTSVVTDGEITGKHLEISWFDSGNCASAYTSHLAYLEVDTYGAGEAETIRFDLGSAPSGSSQLTKSLTNLESPERDQARIELYCGHYSSDSRENLISEVPLRPVSEHDHRRSGTPLFGLWDGTYSSALPLTSLSVGTGTLTPAFHRGRVSYAVPDVPNDVERVTIHTSAYGHGVLFFGHDASFDINENLKLHNGAMFSNNGRSVRPDADPHTPGFQMDLEVGENNLDFTVRRMYGPNVLYWASRAGQSLDPDYDYRLRITRAGETRTPGHTEIIQNYPATGRPKIVIYQNLLNHLNAAYPWSPEALTGLFAPQSGIAPGGFARNFMMVGDMLEAGTEPVDDSDGLSAATFSYQWIRSDANGESDIADATGATYILVADDDGKWIKVRVSFTDDSQNQEAVTSYAQIVGSAVITGLSVSSGTLTPTFETGIGGYQVPDVANDVERITIHVTANGQYVDALSKRYWGAVRACSGQVDCGGLEFANSWQRPYIYNGEPETIVSDADPNVPGFQLDLDVGANRINFFAWSRTTYPPGHVGIVITRAAANAPAMGTPSISGTVEVGETLTVSTSGITDTDGTANAIYSYQWLSGTDTDIDGATGSTYVLLDSDAGKTIKVKVTFTDDRGNEETLISDATVTILPRAFWKGALTVGEYTSAGTTWLGHSVFAVGFGAISLPRSVKVGQHFYTVQLIAHTATDLSLGISREIPEDFILQIGDVTFDSDDASRRQGTSSNIYSWQNATLDWSAGDDVSVALRSEAMAAARPANTEATGAPSISGSPTVGQALTAVTTDIRDTNGMNYAAFRYQWLSNDGTNDSEITDATGSTYTLVDADEGKHVKVRVSFTDLAQHKESVISTAVGPISPNLNSAATGQPTISGTAQVGETLTVSTSDISDSDGTTEATYSYQWLSSRDTEIDGATGSTYMLVDSDAGKTIKVRVTFTDDAGNEETLTSVATVAVAPTVPGAPGNLNVSVNDTGNLDVSWNAPESNGGSAVTGYRVQWKAAADSWDTPGDVSETTVTGTSHTVTGLTDGVEYTFRVLAVNSAGDGSASDVESGTPRETTAPTVSSATVDGATLTLTFSEGLTETPLPAVTTFTVNVGDNQREVNSVAISGSTVTLTLSYAATSTDAVSAGYTVPSDAAAARLKDLSDNPAESFTGQVVTNNTAAAPTLLTASIHDEPSSHDGQSEFTFELQFSEEPKEDFSYKTMRDHVFTVTRGTVKGGTVDGARRLVSGSNIEWQIKIRPTSNGDVTIVLSITEDCDAQGAICTDDGRPLSNRLEITVTGPTSQQTSQQRQENTAATGSPTISGTVQVGQTLAASTTGITDPDGTTNASYSYQWIANDGTSDSDIADATASTYTLVAGDAGKMIKVRVTFTDDAGNEEILTSAATAAVAAAVPGDPGSLSVSVNDTGKLDVSWDAPDSNGGSAVTGYKVQWKESSDSWDTPAEVSETTVTGTSHTVTGLTDGVGYTFRVFAVNSAGDSSASDDASGTPRETTAPTVSSATVEGATLTLTFSEGLTETPLPAVTTFTVNVGDNQREVNSVGISGSTVTLTLSYVATSTDAVSVGYTVPSDAAAARLKDLSDNPAESFTGQTVTNNTAAAPPPLTASIHDEPSSHDGQSEFTFELQFSEEPKEDFSYKTLRDHAFTVPRVTVKGSKVDGARRLVSGSNIGWLIKIRPTSNGDVTIVLPITEDCDADGAICTDDGTMLSSPLEFTVSGPTSQQTSQQRQENTAATGSPTISGTVQVGQTLAASTTGITDPDGTTNASYSYQWIANDGTSDSDIADATASTYTLVAGDAGKMIKVRVTFTDDAGNEEILTSAATAAVAAAVPGDPGSLSVSVNDTGKLDVSWDAPDSNGGSAVTGYRVQWKEAADSWDTPADVSETTVTGTSHTVTGLTDGVEYTFRVFAVNTVGDSSASDDASGTPRETTAAPPTGPDLRVYAILIANTRLSAGVGNYGDVSSAATTLRFYRSTDATITTSDTEVGTDAIGALSAGGRTSSAAIDFTRPSTPGTYYYGACVDTVSGESDTTNNCSGSLSRTVSATTTPDLAVGTPTVSDSTPSAGGSLTLSATVSNRGDGSSGATTLRYYRSTDSTITTSDTSVGTDAVGTLSASGTSAETIDLTAPSEPGTYYYGACVDAVSDESDTTNNCSGSVSITVNVTTAPDLEVGTPTVSDSTPSAGGSLTLSATVRNQGDGSSGATTLRYYRSTDSTITTSDTSVGTDAVGTLSASGTSAETIDLTAPSGPGTYYYGACVDTVSSESDTTNNCSGSVQVTVSAAPPTGPDLRVYAILIANTRLSAGVGNYGDVSSAATTLRFYRSTDATITTSDTEVGTDAIGALSAGGRTSSAAIDFTRPSTPGTYYYGACVDTVSGESDTTNNCSGSVSRTVSDG